MVVLVQVITHAQAKGQPKTIIEEIEQAPTKEQKKKYWRERKAKMAAKKQKKENKKQKQENWDTRATSSSNASRNEGGLVLVDKFSEPLDTLIMAYKSLLKSREPLKKKVGKLSRS